LARDGSRGHATISSLSARARSAGLQLQPDPGTSEALEVLPTISPFAIDLPALSGKRALKRARYGGAALRILNWAKLVPAARIDGAERLQGGKASDGEVGVAARCAAQLVPRLAS
jgi:hypothetical protein